MTQASSALLQAFQAKFPGAKFADRNAPKGEVLRVVELPEFPFKLWGKRAHERGWPVIPQSRNGSRKPGKIGRETIRWSAFVERGVTDAEHAAMCSWSGRDNVALVCGKGTEPGQRVRVIDIDVHDEFRAEKIRSLAIQHLGHTPFQRQGRSPKWALLYREALEPALPMRGRKLAFETNSAAAVEAGSTDAIEILAGGSLITIYGYHHKTQRPFFWLFGDEHHTEPSFSGPEALPEIDADKIDAFLRAVHDVDRLAGFERSTNVSTAFDEVEYDPALKIVTPGHRQRRGVWQVRGGRDVIVDHRKEWALDRTLAWVLLNASHVRAGGPALAQIRKRAIEEALRYVERDGDWQSDGAIERLVGDMFDRTAAKLVEGQFRERTVHIADDGRAYAKPEGIFAVETHPDNDLNFVRPTKKRRRSPSNVLSATPANESVAARRALLDPEKRIAAGREIAATIDATIRGFLTKLWDVRDALIEDPGYLAKAGAAESDEERDTIRKARLRAAMKEALEAIRLLKAPTGSGKTTMTVRIIRELVQTRGSLGMPIAFLLPSHNNIAEVQGVAMEQASPEQISAIWDDVLKEASGLRSMAWKGKITAGCHYSEQMSALYSAGLPGSGLCRQRVKVGDAWEEKTCPMTGACAAMQQLALVAHADVVFLPHAYLTLPIPKQLKESVCALFIDEAIWSQVAQVAFLPLDSLRLPRAEPRISKKEREAGLDAIDLIRGRDEAAEIATRALLGGKDVAQTFFEFSARSSNGTFYAGRDLVNDALDVCRRADHDGLDVRPGMSMSEVEILTAKPQSKDLWLEKRFWTVVQERLDWLELDRKAREQAKVEGRTFDETKRLAKHDRDLALQYRPEHEMPGGKRDVIRVAWFRKMNFTALPLFLMDASANPDMLRTIFSGREIEVTEVDVPLHLRVVLIPETASDLSLLPSARHRDMAGRIRAADRQVEVRSMIGRIATLYGHSRVLVAATKAVRADLMHGSYPANIDWGHYGALKGLNFASRHAAAVCVGRMTSPVAVIDGYAGLFARTAETPELPYDAEGTGIVDGRDLRAFVGERRVALRNGGEMTLACTGYPEHMTWHNAINAQFREEEIRQAIGRLRPVYRADETAPVVFMMSTCVPEGIVVDDVVTLYDLLEDNPLRVDLAQIVGRLGGVLDPLAGGKIAPDMGSSQAIGDAVGRMELRELLGFSSVNVWEDGASEPREVKVAPWVSDIGEALRSASHVAGRELDRFVVTDIVHADKTTSAKGADALDRALSTLPNASNATIKQIRAARADAAVAEFETAWEKWGRCTLTLDGQRLDFASAIILARHGILPSEVKPPPWRAAAPVAA